MLGVTARSREKNAIRQTVPKSQGTNEIEVSLFDKFLKFVSAQRIDKLREHIKMFHGRNFPINYKKQYNFNEQWQGGDTGDSSGDNNLLEDSGLVYFIFSIMLMLLNVATIWVISYERYFETKQISSRTYLYVIQVTFHFADLLLGVYYKDQRQQTITPRTILKGNLQNIMCIIYFGIIPLIDNDSTIFYVIEMVVMGMLYSKASEIFQFMKVMEFGLNYQNPIKIFNLCCNIFIQAHVFALILFSASKINLDKNWVANLGISNEAPFTKYIYSFYFASTTMLTIGYGDITPKCTEEIIITVLIEIVGVVSFGYLLNEMGHTLSKMREQSEELERDLQTISKISKYYNLERKLQIRAKAFLFTNQVKSEELKVEDQNRVLMKLNEELRQQIHHENSLTVVKSCIFFLCHWSKNMQSEIAKRLEKRLFSPNEKLVAANGSSRVYIVKRGRIDIFMNRYGSNQEYRKLLKIVNTKTHQQVSDNIYGYTTVFSNRPVRLEAIAKEFTSTYSVNSDQFLECIRQNVYDFQYYHEIKCRIDQSSFCEEWQAPSIKNIREHFAPSKIVIIKKFRALLQRTGNPRRIHVRRNKLRLKILENLVNKNTDHHEHPSLASFNQNTIEFVEKGGQLNSISEDSQPQLPSDDSSVDSYEKSIEMAIQSIKTRIMTRSVEENDNKRLIAHNFENHHEFKNFFRFNNKSVVLNNLERCNCLEKGVKIYAHVPNLKERNFKF